MTLNDLENYRPILREPIVTSYKNCQVFGFPPPAAGGIAISQILQMMAEQNCSSYSPPFIDLFCGASRLAYADRDYYVADPDFFPVPTERLINGHYLKKRAKLMGKKERALPGKFPGDSIACCPPLMISKELEYPSTTHLCVIDQEGNCVSMTSSLENAFGSTLMAAGFFLNNQLTDFSLIPEKDGKKAANRIEPGKRPMSSMSPTLVFKKGSQRPYLMLGSAGGTRIIDYVAKALLGVLDFNLNIQEAISSPNFTSQGGSIDLESQTVLVESAEWLEKLGNTIKITPLTSGTQGIQRTEKGLLGGADPRREGEALGD